MNITTKYYLCIAQRNFHELPPPEFLNNVSVFVRYPICKQVKGGKKFFLRIKSIKVVQFSTQVGYKFQIILIYQNELNRIYQHKRFCCTKSSVLSRSRKGVKKGIRSSGMQVIFALCTRYRKVRSFYRSFYGGFRREGEKVC